MIDTVIMSGVVLGLLAFAGWTVRVWSTSEAPGASADWTSRLVYHTGMAVIWLSALVIVGAVLGTVARAVWRLG